jgi:peptide/nickel transport system permease protein
LISLSIVTAASAISVVLGTTLGMIAGYYRGWFDIVIMRAVDVQLAIPFILLILLIVAVIGPSMANLVVVLGITGWAVFARVARAKTLEIRELEYVDASRSIGLPDRTIIFRHILPNIIGPQTVLMTLDLPRLIILEASVGFLGLGVQPPTPTLGNLIGEGRSYILLANWLILYPGLVIGALVIGCNLIGDWLVRRADSRNA